MTQYNYDVDTVFSDICTAIGQKECLLFVGCGLAGQAYVQDVQTSIEYSKHPPSSRRETLTAIFKQSCAKSRLRARSLKGVSSTWIVLASRVMVPGSWKNGSKRPQVA